MYSVSLQKTTIELRLKLTSNVCLHSCRNAVIQGVESPSRRQSLVLENLGATPPTSRFMLDESTSNIPVQTTPTRRQSLVLENQSATPYTHRPKSGASSTGSAKRQSLVLENLETEESLKTLHSDLLDIVTSI